MIVADTNLVAYLLIESERTEAARAVRQRDADWKLPTIWRSEFLNVLVVAIRRRVLSRAEALETWHRAVALFRAAEVEPAGQDVLRGAVQWGLTAYDAQFAVAAIDLGVPLVTSDKAMLAACSAFAVAPEDFAE